MSYEELLRLRIIEPVEITDEEVAALLAVARRDIETAKNVIGIDLDWAFAIAYNSILQLTLAWMNHLGYRPRGEAKHINTFKFLQETLPEERQPIVRRLQKMRKKRNASVYRQRGLISEREAHEVIAFAEDYYQEIEATLPSKIARMSREED